MPTFSHLALKCDRTRCKTCAQLQIRQDQRKGEAVPGAFYTRSEFVGECPLLLFATSCIGRPECKVRHIRKPAALSLRPQCAKVEALEPRSELRALTWYSASQLLTTPRALGFHLS